MWHICSPGLPCITIPVGLVFFSFRLWRILSRSLIEFLSNYKYSTCICSLTAFFELFWRYFSHLIICLVLLFTCLSRDLRSLFVFFPTLFLHLFMLFQPGELMLCPVLLLLSPNTLFCHLWRWRCGVWPWSRPIVWVNGALLFFGAPSHILKSMVSLLVVVACS